MTAWTDTDNQDLTRLWKEGHSTKEIGRRLQRSKNSVVGRAHRLELDERPSPIIRKSGAPPRVKTAPRPLPLALPPLASIESPPPVSAPRPVTVRREPRPVPPPLRIDATRVCEWLDGPRHHYVRCGAVAVGGTSWCRWHFGICFVKRGLVAA